MLIEERKGDSSPMLVAGVAHRYLLGRRADGVARLDEKRTKRESAQRR